MMNTLTLRIESLTVGADGNPGYLLVLLEGSPWSLGREIARGERPLLDTAGVKEQVLDRTADPDTLGKLLGDFLLGGQPGAEWNASTGRTYLEVRVPALKDLPWEFARFQGQPLFLDHERPFSVIDTSDPPERAPEWGLRMLVIIAAQDDDDAIQVWREIYAIRNAIRTSNRIIDLKSLLHPKRPAIRLEVESYRPHVLHIIGHGNDAGLLLFNGTNLTPWDAGQIFRDVGDWSWKPELVYLNTCRSVGTKLSPLEQERQWNVVDSLIKRGVAAVIAMQADVRGDLAGACAGRFYEKVAAGEVIDKALARGRLFVEQTVEGGENSVDCYLPKLVVARPVETILRYKARTDLQECPEIRDALARFVDRDQPRRELVRLLEENKPVVLIEGPADAGKTWLLRWCMDAWRRRGMDIRYVPVSGCRTWLDVVRAIRDGDLRYAGKSQYVTRGLAAQQCALLNWRLNKLAEGTPDPAASTFRGNEQENRESTRRLVELTVPLIDPHIRSMAALHDVLQEEARRLAAQYSTERPLVIVLDNFVAGDQGLTEMHFAVLLKHWLDAFVSPGTSSVRVVLGLKSEQVKEYNLETLPAGYSKVSLEFFRKEEFSDTILDLMPLRHPFQDEREQEKALSWVRQEMRDYNPELAGEPLSGPIINELCKEIHGYCIKMRRRWDHP